MKRSTGRTFHVPAVVLVIISTSSIACSNKPPPPPTPVKNQIIKVVGTENKERKGDVIFIHGLDGDADASWRFDPSKEAYWPKWVGDYCPDVGVWSVNYNSHSSEWFGPSMPIGDRSKNLLELLRLNGIGERPIVFVTHSLGGLVVKQMLRDALTVDAKWKPIAVNTKGVVFIATPNTGSDKAVIVKYIQSVAPAVRTTTSVTELQRNASQLRELNIWYRNNVSPPDVETRVFYENQPLGAAGIVVDEASADPGISKVTPIRIDADHISICKPRSKEDQLFLSVVELVKNRLVDAKNPIEDSLPKAGSTLKLVDVAFSKQSKTPLACEIDVKAMNFAEHTALLTRLKLKVEERWDLKPGNTNNGSLDPSEVYSIEISDEPAPFTRELDLSHYIDPMKPDVFTLEIKRGKWKTPFQDSIFLATLEIEYDDNKLAKSKPFMFILRFDGSDYHPDSYMHREDGAYNRTIVETVLKRDVPRSPGLESVIGRVLKKLPS